MGLLGVLALGIYVAMIFMARQQRALQQATLAARQLGQYTLEEKLGAGGMGTVYRARHAMLRRPTAVKLLETDKMSAERGGLHDVVKVLDFGLVKARAGAEQANLTSPNELMGTPLYMAPEAVNKPDAVDARADVYALGAVAYYLLTGTPVFSAPSLIEIC